MIGIIWSKIRLFIRIPGSFILMTVLSLVFALVIGLADTNKVNVPVYEADNSDIRDSIMGEELDDSDVYSIQWMTKDEAEKEIADGKAEFGVGLEKDTFRILVGVDSGQVELFRQTIQKAYTQKIQFDQMVAETNDEKNGDILRTSELNAVIANPVFGIQTNNFHGKDTAIYNHTFQALFGFTLFFVMYTIANNVFQILYEKEQGVWDRLILSPLKKWEMYAGNFIYSFCSGYLQVLIVFLVFRYIVGIDFAGNFLEVLILLIPYVFAIVAMCILITGLVKKVQQFNAVISIVALSTAMIGGAFWPLEIVETEWFLTLSKFVPITYGMEILTGAAVYGKSVGELLFPVSILLLMGVVMTGIGLHLMEKRHI